MGPADIRRELIPGRIAVWLMLLSGLIVDGRGEWRVQYFVAWLLLVVASTSALFAGRRIRTARYVLPLVELAGTTLLVGFAGAGSYLGVVYLMVAASYLLAYPPRTATLLGLASVACYASLIPLDPTLVPFRPETLGVLLVGVGLLILVVLGAYLSHQLAAARAAVGAAQANREREREEAARLASAMLDATNAFLRCDDLDELARATVTACGRVFRGHRFALLLAEEGRFRPAGGRGIADEDLAMLAAAMSRPDGVGAKLRAGETLWMGESPKYTHRTAGIHGGFVVPIRGGGETLGALGVVVDDPAADGPQLRESGGTVAAQVALAYELITARQGLRSNAVALAGEAWRLETAVAERTRQLNEAIHNLQVANRAKSEFLANVSHELRTPLTAIVGFTDVLLAGIDGPLGSDQHDDVETIHRSGRRLLELIDDLIDISRIEAGRAELRRERIDPRRTLEEAVEELRPAAGEKGLELAFACDGLPEEAWLDPVRVRQIVVNLVENAVKFTPSGSVRVRATAAAARAGDVPCDVAQGFPGADLPAGDAPDGAADPPTEALVVEVVDTGTGIMPGDLQRIFDKFQRAAGPDQPGTGLGLPIAREFARLHGGDVSAESTRGLGSRFVVTLPLLDPPACALAAAPVPAAVGAA